MSASVWDGTGTLSDSPVPSGSVLPPRYTGSWVCLDYSLTEADYCLLQCDTVHLEYFETPENKYPTLEVTTINYIAFQLLTTAHIHVNAYIFFNRNMEIMIHMCHTYFGA